MFEYSKNGISVRVQNVWVWVCPEDGEVSFTPETVDVLIDTVRELVDTTKREKKRILVLTDYAVAVG